LGFRGLQLAVNNASSTQNTTKAAHASQPLPQKSNGWAVLPARPSFALIDKPPRRYLDLQRPCTRRALGHSGRRPSWGSGWSSRLNPLRPRDSRIQRRGLLVVDASASGASRPLRTYLPTDYVQAYYLLGPSPSRLPPSPIIQMHPSTDLAPRIVPQPLLSCRGSMPWRPANSI